MDKPIPQNPTVAPAKTGNMNPPKAAPSYTKQDPKETAQEAVHQVTPKDVIKADPAKKQL